MKRIEMKIILFCLIFLHYVVLIVYSLNDETYLWKDIMNNRDYNKYIRRPTLKRSEPTEVEIEIVLYTIRSLNMKNQILTTSLGIKMSWTDDFLTWNRSLYGETNKISAPLSKIWKPDICLTNYADKSNCFENEDTLVNIYSDGLVERHDFVEVKTYCFVDTTRYPFETENCKIKFSAQNLDNKEQVLSIRMQDKFLTQFKSNGEWIISKSDQITTNTTVHNFNGKNFSGVVLNIEMNRRQTYYVWKFLIPSIAVTFINIVTFCLPVKSGAKVTLSTFVLLSFTVMIQLFNESLPSSSDKISHFGRLLWYLLCISGIILIVNVIIIAIFYRKCLIFKTCEKEGGNTNEEKEKKKLHTKAIFISRSRSICCCRNSEDDGNKPIEEETSPKKEITGDSENLIAENKDETKEREKIEKRRKKIAAYFEVICFFVMCILYGGVYLYFLCEIFKGEINVA